MLRATTDEISKELFEHRRKVQAPLTVARDETIYRKALKAKLGKVGIGVVYEKREVILDWIDGMENQFVSLRSVRDLKRIFGQIINYYLWISDANIFEPEYKTRPVRLGEWASVSTGPIGLEEQRKQLVLYNLEVQRNGAQDNGLS